MWKVILALSLISAVAALGAAVFWYRSAPRDLPPMQTYWDGAPPNDPLYQALKAGVHDSRIAALLAGVAAVASLSAAVLSAVQSRRP